MVPLETRPGSPHASAALYRYPAMMMQHVTAMLWGHNTACAHTTKHLIWPGQGAVAVRSDLRVDSRFAPSQWDMALLCNISHWQGADLVSALYLVCFVQDCSNSSALAMELLQSCTISHRSMSCSERDGAPSLMAWICISFEQTIALW